MSAPALQLSRRELVDDLDVVKFRAAFGSPGISPAAVLRAKGFGPAQIDATLWDFRRGGSTAFTATLAPVAP